MLCKGFSIAALLFSVGSLPWLPSEGDCNCDITRVLRLNYFSGLIFDRIVHGSYWLAKLMSGHIPFNLIQVIFLKSGILSCSFATFCRLLPQISLAQLVAQQAFQSIKLWDFKKKGIVLDPRHRYSKKRLLSSFCNFPQNKGRNKTFLLCHLKLCTTNIEQQYPGTRIYSTVARK